MRIVHVNHRYAPFTGGSERHVQELAEPLARMGHAARVVVSNAWDLEYLWDPRRRAVDAPAREIIAGVEVERVPVRHLPASSFVFRGLHRAMGESSRLPIPAGPLAWVARHQPWLPDLRATLDAGGPPDLVLAMNMGLEGLALTAYDYARAHAAAYVMMPLIHLGEDGDAVARRFASMPHQRKLLRAADAVMAMTPREAAFICSLGVEPAKLSVVGAGVHPAEVSGGDGARFRERFGLHGPLVGALGAQAPDKGTMTLVEAVTQLRASGTDVQVVLAGPALGAFERWWQARPAQARQGIHLLGMVDHATKRDLLAAIDMLALPSRTESFGIVFLEAWANAKPVIGARAGGIPDLIRDGETGLLAEFDDVPGLAAAISRLLADGRLRNEFGERGRDEVARTHTWGHAFARTRAVYERVLGFSLEAAT